MQSFQGLSVPQSLAEIADPRRSALVVYDMQVGILRQLPHGSDVLERVLQLLAAARSANVPIFFMRHMSLPQKLAGVFQLRQAMAWQRVSTPAEVKPWFLRDSPGFQLAPELGVRDDEAILDKISMSAFEGTPLAMALRDLGRQSLAICGIATEIGIEPTVRHAADLGTHSDRRPRCLRSGSRGSRRADVRPDRLHRRRAGHGHRRAGGELDVERQSILRDQARSTRH